MCFNMFCYVFAVFVCCSALRCMYKNVRFLEQAQACCKLLLQHALQHTLHYARCTIHSNTRRTTHCSTLQCRVKKLASVSKHFATCNTLCSTHYNSRCNTHCDTCCKHRVEKLARAGASTVGCAETRHEPSREPSATFRKEPKKNCSENASNCSPQLTGVGTL